MSAEVELIDSHCHLNHSYGQKTEADLVREAEANGVSTLITIGTDEPGIAQVQAISERFPHVYHTVGVHPHDAIDFKPETLERLREAAKHTKCRGIGEIGLDYHYDHSPRDVQRDVFEKQLELALAVRQPVIIHTREADEDLLVALKPYAAQVPEGSPAGVIHCFSGTRELGEGCLDLGFYISFSGIITFKNADDLRACARDFPLDRILVETDSPYLAPVPYRGKKCEPYMVRFTAMKIAELRGISLEELARHTTANTKKLFRI